MRTNIIIEEQLMSEAMRVAGVTTKKAAVENGLRLLIDRARRLEALDQLAGIGWDGDLDEIRGGTLR
jgi:Arc/MetJ family transcription regulator